MLATHSALVGLTPIIPVPFLDDVVKAYIERRMTRDLARRRAVDLDDDAVRAIAEGPGDSIFGAIGRGALLLPVKLFFRKVFVFLEVKRGADAASTCFHRGLMLDMLLARGALRERSPAEVRAAIDRVLAGLTTSPVTVAFRRSFESSKDLLNRALGSLLAALAKRRGEPTAASVEAAVGDVEGSGSTGTIADRLRRALGEVPAEYFDDLERRICEELGVAAASG